MQKQAIHTERIIRAGWPELLPLTSLSACLLCGLPVMATRLPRGPFFSGIGLAGGVLLYLLLFRRGPHLPANALPFLAASGIGYLCLLVLPQIQGLAPAACLLIGLGAPAALLPLMTLAAVGPQCMGARAPLAMLGSALISAGVLRTLVRACSYELFVLLSAVGFLVLLLHLAVFCLMPALCGTVTIYQVESQEPAHSKLPVIPRKSPPAPIAQESDPAQEEQAFEPFRPPNLLDRLMQEINGEPRQETHALDPDDPDSGEPEPQVESAEPQTPILEALLDDFARRQQEKASETAGGEPSDDFLQPPAREPQAESLPVAALLPDEQPKLPSEPAQFNPFYDTLSEKERELAALILRGYTESSVASSMGITVNTQKSYRKNLYTKLEIHAKRELFELAAQHRFTGDEPDGPPAP